MVSQTLKNNGISLSAAVALGGLWGHSLVIWPLAATLLLPVLWSRVSHRWLAGLVPALYALVATRGLIQGSAVYFDTHLGFGGLLWLAAAIPHYLAGVLAWFSRLKMRVYVGIPLLCLWLLLPPVMLVGWTHPLLAAGLWFPRLGIGSLLGGLALMVFIAANPPRRYLFTLLALISVQAIMRHAPLPINATPNWIAHDTALPTLTRATPLAILQRQWDLQTQVNGAGVHVFPESVAGVWKDFLSNDWINTVGDDATVLMGAYQHTGVDWQNVILAINRHGSRVIYQQRLPMTAGMFNPFSKTHFVANWGGQSVVNFNGQRVGFALCFEQVVLLTMLQTTWQRPDILVAPANIWWSPRSLQLAQRQSLRLWQHWLGIPVIEAINGVKS